MTLVAWLVAGSAASVLAQGPDAGDFQSYRIVHGRAAELEPVLVKVLSALGDRVEVLTDARGNRLLVRGPAAAHRLTRELLERIDRPEDPAAASPAPSQPVLHAYPYPGADRDQAIARAQAHYPANTGVRIAADARTGQILILAPAEMHAEIRQRLGIGDGPATASRPPRQAAVAADPNALRAATATETQRPQAATATEQGTYQLRRMQPTTLEGSLAKLWGERMTALAKTSPDYSSYLVGLVDGARMELHVNQRTGQVVVRGPAGAQAMCLKLIAAMDDPAQASGGATRVIPVRTSPPEQLQRTIQALSTVNQPAAPRAPGAEAPSRTAVLRNADRRGLGMIARVFQEGQEGGQQPPPEAANEPQGPEQPGQQPGREAQPGEQPPPGEEEDAGLVGPVQIEFLEGMDAIIVRGNDRDVQRVLKIIEDIEKLSVETVPVIELYQLKHVGSEALAAIITQLYDQVLSPRQGSVSITALVKPNALLLIGRAESVKTVLELVTRLDQPVDPSMQFEVFRLKHAPAATAQATITEFFAEPTGLGTKARATADVRSNSLIVQASPRDLLEVADLLKRIDTPTSAAVNELRVFKLQNVLAEELAPVLQEAVSGDALQQSRNRNQQGGQQGGLGALFGLGQGGQQGQGGQGSRNAQLNMPKSIMLQLLTVDGQGQRRLDSGILTDVRITADPRGNSLIVSAPGDSMELLSALITQLDQAPAAVSQIKVFTIDKGDATQLVELLQTLFGQATQQRQGGFGFQQQQLPAFTTEGSLVPVRFSVDSRTNSIIASGSAGDLQVVEAILLRLDASDVGERKTKVYFLKNSPAQFVADAINQLLRSERDVTQATPDLLSPFEQIEREVIVVPEIVSNSLIVSATPRYYDEIARVVEELDRRPPMVMIQVMIAEVTLSNADEFGVELGLQDSILFDRSLVDELVTIDTSTTQSVAGGGTIATQTQSIIGASNVPGFVFNSPIIGNSASDRALANSNRIGSQGLTNFAVGRTNSDLGFGGLVLSAGSDSVSILLRALQESRRLEVLSRPQIMTLDNQQAYVLVGQTVPRINGSSTNANNQLVNTLNDVNVGIVLGVTPRISPDGLVVMEIDAEKSQVGPDIEGIPISVAPDGVVLRSPRIDRTLAQTTVSAVSGQTVVLGGLITKTKQDVHRRAPYLSSIPVLGNFFRYDSTISRRTELLIIMTPHVVRNEDDANVIKQTEAARMSWCLADVQAIHGDGGLRGRMDEWTDAETTVIYPDATPSETLPPPGEGGPSMGVPRVIEDRPVLPPDAMPPGALPPQAVPPNTPPPLTPPQGANKAPASSRRTANKRPGRSITSLFRRKPKAETNLAEATMPTQVVVAPTNQQALGAQHPMGNPAVPGVQSAVYVDPRQAAGQPAAHPAQYYAAPPGSAAPPGAANALYAPPVQQAPQR